MIEDPPLDLCAFELSSTVVEGAERLCVREAGHDGDHVVALLGQRELRFYSVNVAERTLKPQADALLRLKPGETIDREERAAVWAFLLVLRGRGASVDEPR